MSLTVNTAFTLCREERVSMQHASFATPLERRSLAIDKHDDSTNGMMRFLARRNKLNRKRKREREREREATLLAVNPDY
jgi:hypothetical protein